MELTLKSLHDDRDAFLAAGYHLPEFDYDTVHKNTVEHPHWIHFGAGKVYICSTFGFFTDGLEKFDEAHKKGYFDKLLTTNLVYQSPELLEKPYYISCDMSKYIALIIDTLNHDNSVSHLLNPVDRIKRCVTNYMSQHEK